MKNQHFSSKVTLIFSVLSVLFFVSCTKEAIQSETTPAVIANQKDSASYTIEGKRYTCDQVALFGRGNFGANRDSISGYFTADTILYYSEFGLMKQRDADMSDDGDLIVNFIRKYAKSQLTKSPANAALLQPNKVSDHYSIGKYIYVTDFEKDNRQNGVKLLVAKRNGNEKEILSSQPQLQGTIATENTGNTTFEVTRFDAVGDGSYILEAKFTANVFDRNDKAIKVENGFLRYHVR